ncbi:MAG: lamin tail domain-containing protein [Deltaproteobacteria bacterium]|nr:lamin tail domain-containing protein [Deltaproteobacteria bacterium]
MWRFASAAQISAWTSTDLTVSGCPATAVVATIPADATTAVSVDGTIGVQFNVPMDPATLTAQTTEGACTGSVQVSTDNFVTCISMATAAPTLASNNSIATFTPSPHLSYGSTYKVRVLGTASAPGAGRTLGADFTSANGFSTGAQSTSCVPEVVISQIYGGGGNTGATFTHDFVELHNRGTAMVSLSGMSVQYGSATSMDGTAWQVTTLPAVNLMPGQYYLVREATGGNVGTAISTQDHIGAINMSATAGKVALVNGVTPIAVACPTGATIRDLVGFGTTANCREGTPQAVASNAPAGSNTMAIQRAGAGCTDTDQNSTNFAAATPVIRNTATTAMSCTCTAVGDRTANESGLGPELDFCNLQSPATLTVTAGATSAAVLGTVYEMNVTEAAGAAAAPFAAQVGVGPASANPENQSGWTWTNATFVQQTGTGNNDEQYTGTFTAPATAGSYRYTYRFSLDGTNWTYCDLNGAGSNTNLSFETTQLGVLTVP